jgi:hypothetical protein
MHEEFAVVFRDGSATAAGVLAVEQDRLFLEGRGKAGALELEIPFSDLSAVRVGRRQSERLNGYATLILERTTLPPVEVAPLGVALLPEIANLLVTLTQQVHGDVLALVVPLRRGCLDRARKLLEKGPPIDPARLGVSEHEVYLDENAVIFVFRGRDVRARVGQAVRHPAVWRAGLEWQSCFAGPPQILEAAEVRRSSAPVYRWASSGQPS